MPDQPKGLRALPLLGEANVVGIVDIDAQKHEQDKENEKASEDPAFEPCIANIVRHVRLLVAARR